MKLSNINLNVFVIFDAIYTEDNLTRTSQIIGISQANASNALAGLKQTLNDPLFIRTAQIIVATPPAQNIINPARDALRRLRTSVHGSRILDAGQASTTLRLSMTDVSENILLTATVQRLHKGAPYVQKKAY